METLMSQPGCYAVIFTSTRTEEDAAGYAAMAEEMERLARTQPGFMSIDSVRGADGRGITVSYWESLEAIERWKADLAHQSAQRLGRGRWYAGYSVCVARVERAHGFKAIRG